MRIGDLRSARTPHQGRRARISLCSTVGPGTAPRAPFRSRDRARYRYYEGSRSDPAVTACQHYFENCSFSRDVMRQSSRAVLRQRSNCVRSCLRVRDAAVRRELLERRGVEEVDRRRIVDHPANAGRCHRPAVGTAILVEPGGHFGVMPPKAARRTADPDAGAKSQHGRGDDAPCSPRMPGQF